MNMNNISALNPYVNQAEAYHRLNAKHDSSRIASFHNIKNEDPVAITDPQTLRSIKDNGERDLGKCASLLLLLPGRCLSSCYHHCRVKAAKAEF